MSRRRPSPIVALPFALCLAWPIAASADPVIVNDITQLNPIPVARVVTPRTVDEVRELVRGQRGPISIGGGRFSMGGQIASEGSLFLDMRGMDRVVAFSPDARTITVEPGITWRTIQERIDPRGLSVKIMQSYANFTVGGSLSVNVHGRYVGQGPLIGSVRSIKLVLADGQLVQASPSEHAELFYGAIGGYGGLGVIVEATLELTENQRVARAVRKLPVTEYKDFFFSEVRESPTAVFHNGDLYPPAYDTVMAITWSATDRPLTVSDRLMPIRNPNWADRLELFGVSEMPFGKVLRARVLDPLKLRDNPVVWRNYEASYDVRALEPRSRARSTYVLQEYFVPVERFDEFVPQMAGIFRHHRVNVLNVSIRHARKDPGSLLAWAKEESFAFVVYYRQGVTDTERREVGDWTRELIDAALAVGGSYYLPYQIHATDAQFRRAYPRAEEFFALKSRVDPDYRFRNKLWDRYLPPPKPAPAALASAEPQPAPAALVSAERSTEFKLRSLKNYARSEDQTYLTLPEWYIVYSADEYAAFLDGHRPSGFPFFRSIGQFWRIYRAVLGETWNAYRFNWGYHAMIGAIGTSWSFGYAVSGLYEGSVGRLTEWISARAPGAPETAEDRFIREVAGEYAAFIHGTPWYEFRFAQKLGPLWALTAVPGASSVRRWERRLSFTVELLFKSAWGWLVRKATRSAYTPEASEILAWTRKPEGAPLRVDPPARLLEPPDAHSELISLPRYEPFTAAVTKLARQGVRFVEIAGNRRILTTVIAPSDWKDTRGRGDRLVEWDILTQPGHKRVAFSVAVDRLHEVIPSLEAERVKIDHIYDY
jgi:FAD/FMN-containing dehydrogenase